MCFGELASTPVFQGVIAENTCIYVQYTCIYVIYIHIHAYTCIYILYIHIHTSVHRGQEVFSRGCSRRLRAPGWSPTGQICCGCSVARHGTGLQCADRALETSVRNERGASWAQDACRGLGCAKSGVHNLCQLLNKVEAQMPWGALSVARRLPPTESDFGGRGIGSSV